METLLILFGTIAGGIMLVNPFFGLLVIIALIPQALIPKIGYSFLFAFSMMTPIKIVGAVTFVGSVIQGMIKRMSLSFLRKGGFLWYTLFLLYLFTSGFAQPTVFSRELFTTFTSFWVFGFSILVLVTNMKRFRWAILIAVVAFTIAAAQSVMAYLTNPNYAMMMVRLQGTNYDPNYFAINLLPIMVLSFYAGLAEKNKFWKIILLLSPVVMAAALVLTQSRGGLLGLAVMLLFVVVRAKNKILAFITVGCVALTLVFVMPQSVWERFEKTRLEDTRDQTIGSTVRRYYLAKAAWEMFLDHPVFGAGPGSYYYNCRLYYPLAPGRAHTMYLEIMAEMGGVGITLFMLILWSVLQSNRKVIKNSPDYSSYARGLYLGLIGFMTAALFLHAQNEKSLWFIVFLSLALRRIADQEKKEKLC